MIVVEIHSTLMMQSFRTRILALVLGLVTVTLLATVGAVVVKARQEARERAAEQLRAGAEFTHEFLRFRGAQLNGAVRVLAADFGFREAVASADSPTILSAIANHGSRIGAGLVVLMDVEGNVITSTVPELSSDARVGFADMIRHRPTRNDSPAIRIVGGRPYQLVLAPVRAPEVIAWVAMGFPVDGRLAGDIARLVGVDVSFLGASPGAPAFTATSLSAADRSVLDGVRAQPAGRIFVARSELDQYFSLVESLPTAGGVLHVVLDSSMAAALRPYQELRLAIVGIGGSILLAAVILAILLANSATRPVKVLTDSARRIESGDYSFEVSGHSTREFTRLAAAFNSMRSAVAEREDQILFHAQHDALTGLPNRTRAALVLDELIARGTPGEPIATCVVDLQRFRDVNASLGHDVGDAVLKEAARRLTIEVPGPDRVARLGADKFLVILAADSATARHAVADLGTCLRAGLDVEGLSILLESRAGVASYPEHGASAAELLRGADIALHKAKESSATVCVYARGDEAEHRRRLAVLGDLRRAIEADELEVHYQPKADVRSGRVVGCEALVRWHSPQHGHIAPSEFVAYAERTGAIRLLTSWVLRSAFRQLRLWQDAGLDLTVAVNLSASDLTDPDLGLEIMALLDETRACPARVLLEITESTAMRELPNAIRIMEQLRLLGVRFSIDDFGTGYSSLASLQRLPVDELKIDRAFVRDLGAAANDGVIVRSTVDLGHAMGLKVVAEGVEDESALRALRALGCDLAQGYLLSRPLPAHEFCDWLAAQPALATPTRLDAPQRDLERPRVFRTTG
jgi:diguanylate cyclase (GGDEF)-like protein